MSSELLGGLHQEMGHAVLHGERQIFARISTSDPASTGKLLVGVRVLAGVRVGMIELASTDLQKAQIMRHEAGVTEAESAARRLYNRAAAISEDRPCMAGVPLGPHGRQARN